MSREYIGTFHGSAVYADSESLTISVLLESSRPPLLFAHRFDFDGGFLRWVERRIDWTVPK